jgi:outer membrane protein insertion porin family
MRILLFSILILFQVMVAKALAFEPFVVKKIEVQGVQKVSKDTILYEVNSYIGKNFTNEDSNAVIKQIFKTGYFSNVVLSQHDNVLVINVTERPSIAKLEFVGTKKSQELEDILKEFDIVEGRVYNSSAMRKAEKKIQQFFMSQKRFSVLVSSKVTELPRNRVNVELIVTEGVIPQIKEIKFIGNKTFSSRQLISEMSLSTKGLFSWYTKSHEYSREKLDADIEVIKSYYKDRGYLRINIESTQVSLSDDKAYAYIAIYLNEGERYYFDTPYLEGTYPIPKEKILHEINSHIIKGQPFSDKKIWTVKEKIELLLGDKGYSKADIRIMTDVNDQAKIVKIGYFINPGKQITIRKINIVGNGLTKDQVLRREIEQYEGSLISTTKIKEGKEAIIRRGYAKTVDVETINIPGIDDQADLWIKIVEQKNSQASASIGYTTAGGGLTGQVGLKTMNFLGSGMDVGVSGMINKITTAASVSFFDPYFTKSGVGFGVNLFYRRTNLSQGSDVGDYVTDSAGMSFNWQWRLSNYMSYNLGTGFANTRLKLNQLTAPIEALAFINAYPNVSRFKEYTVSNSITYNSLDTPIMTNEGYYANLMLSATAPFSNLLWYQLNFDQAYFKPIYKDLLIYNFKMELGFIDTYGLSRNRPFPFFKNYYMGGPDTIRGFKENAVGPLDSNGKPFGGNSSILIRNQILFPPPFFSDIKSVRFALFLDVGQVYDTRQKISPTGRNMNPTGMRYTTGLSATWHTPFGVPIGISVARPIFRHASDKDKVEVFTFSFGTELF